MKCDELKPLVFSLNELAFIDEPAVQKNFENHHDHAVYKATDVDAAIAELKAQLESEKESRYAESVDAGMRERRLKRALYKACSNWACAKMEYEQFDSNVFMFGVTTTDKEVSWESMMKKCQAKAEEYK